MDSLPVKWVCAYYDDEIIMKYCCECIRRGDGERTSSLRGEMGESSRRSRSMIKWNKASKGREVAIAGRLNESLPRIKWNVIKELAKTSSMKSSQ